MDESQTELETFKIAINLVEYAGSLGYAIDPKKTCKTSAVMLHPNGDKVVIVRQANNGHWTYFSVHDQTDNGTIIDFCQKRTGGNLGHVRKTLRAFMGSAPLPDRRPAVIELQPVTRDVAALRARFEGMPSLEGHHPYLVDERCIPIALLTSPRFAGTVRIDDRGNVIFPHTDDVGELTGWEVKNAGGFSGFASGGTKSLYRSATDINDQRLVIAESSLDAFSHAALFPDEHARYVSIAGKMNPDQPALLTAAIENMTPGSQIIAATDNDEAGHEFGEQIKTLTIAAGLPLTAFKAHMPETTGQDWNAILKERTPRKPRSTLDP